MDLSTLSGQTQIKVIDKTTAVRYSVVEEVIDLEALRQEKAGLEEQLKMPEPTKEELIEAGKVNHPYYQDKTLLNERLAKINSILGE